MSKRILTVDDSTSVRQLQNAVLTAAGYEVVQAVDGKDALAQLERNTFQLIVTDLNMPNLDGIGLIKAVRGGKPPHKLVPIIMLTTESQDSRKQEGRAAGATGWIVKPFTPDQLVGVVKKVLG